MRLVGKNTIVTGAASGIGRETAIRFAEEGAAVICADLDDVSDIEMAEDSIPFERRCQHLLKLL